MQQLKTDSTTYNYEYVVERKYPLLDLLGEVRKVVKKGGHIKATPIAKFQQVAIWNRSYIRNRLQIIFWVVEDMVNNSPKLIERGGYMDSYTEAKKAYPEVIRILNKVQNFKEGEAKTVDRFIRNLNTFISEST